MPDLGVELGFPGAGDIGCQGSQRQDGQGQQQDWGLHFRLLIKNGFGGDEDVGPRCARSA